MYQTCPPLDVVTTSFLDASSIERVSLGSEETTSPGSEGEASFFAQYITDSRSCSRSRSSTVASSHTGAERPLDPFSVFDRHELMAGRLPIPDKHYQLKLRRQRFDLRQDHIHS